MRTRDRKRTRPVRPGISSEKGCSSSLQQLSALPLTRRSGKGTILGFDDCFGLLSAKIGRIPGSIRNSLRDPLVTGESLVVWSVKRWVFIISEGHVRKIDADIIVKYLPGLTWISRTAKGCWEYGEVMEKVGRGWPSSDREIKWQVYFFLSVGQVYSRSSVYISKQSWEI